MTESCIPFETIPSNADIQASITSDKTNNAMTLRRKEEQLLDLRYIEPRGS